VSSTSRVPRINAGAIRLAWIAGPTSTADQPQWGQRHTRNRVSNVVYLPCPDGDRGSLLLLGNLAIRAGVGKKVLWDGPSMKCTNRPELNQYVERKYRDGWA
jgi:hypothetical protein